MNTDYNLKYHTGSKEKINLNDYLETLSVKGLDDRLTLYTHRKDYNELAKKYTERLQEELKIIRATGYTSYFLTVEFNSGPSSYALLI